MEISEAGDLKIITFSTNTCDFIKFVDFWSKAYESKDDDLRIYQPLLKKSPKGEEDVRALFKWKNGGKLSKLKEKSLENKILKNLKIELLAKVPANVTLNEVKGLVTCRKT